ncbi:MAG TPA: DUF1003 domain-containing protein [Trebonia sp.]
MSIGKAARSAVRSERRSFIRQRRRLQDRIADQITAFAGSMAFVYLHVAWFAVWIVLNVTGLRFDPFPFGLLTLIVSLEAIFLSTFVMISQNREAARSDLRAKQDFETNALSEAWLEALGDKLGVDVAAVHAAAKQRIRRADAQADKLNRPG